MNMKEKLQGLMARLEQGKLAPLVQFIKFGLVGVSNTLITYAVEMLGYYVLFVRSSFAGIVAALGALGIAATGEQMRVIVVTLLSFVISVTNSYYWNSRYVFKSGKKRSLREHAGAYLRTVACYALTGILLSPAIKLWLGNIGIPFWAASLMSLIVTIPLNFVMNKFWAFARKGDKSYGNKE